MSAYISPKSKKWIITSIVTLPLAFFVLYFLYSLLDGLQNYQDPSFFHWDFRIYYSAAEAYINGANPYDVSIGLEYRYPPYTLWFFVPFTLFDINMASGLYFIFQCILLFTVIYLWIKGILKKEIDLLFFPFCLFAYNFALLTDILAGNIVLLEQILIWLAFYYFMKKGRLMLFCLFIILAATFKIQPILFLILLLFSKDEKRYMYLFGSVAVFGAIHLVSYLSNPTLLTSWIENGLMGLDWQTGIINPSTFALVQDILEFSANKTGLSVPQIVPWVIFSAIVVAVVLISWRSIVKLRTVEIVDNKKILIFLACLVYVLIDPRLKDYSFILLLVPTYYIIRSVSYMKLGVVLLYSQVIFMIIFSLYGERMPHPGSIASLVGYYPLIVAYLVWGLYLYWIRSRSLGRAGKSVAG